MTTASLRSHTAVCAESKDYRWPGVVQPLVRGHVGLLSSANQDAWFSEVGFNTCSHTREAQHKDSYVKHHYVHTHTHTEANTHTHGS